MQSIASAIRAMQVENALLGTPGVGVRWDVGVDFWKAWELSASPIKSIDINPSPFPLRIQTMAGMPIALDPSIKANEAMLIDDHGNVVKIFAIDGPPMQNGCHSVEVVGSDGLKHKANLDQPLRHQVKG